MTPDAVPSAIVAQLVEAAQELERWAEMHRTAISAQYEQGVLAIFRRVMGPTLDAVLAHALGLD